MRNGMGELHLPNGDVFTGTFLNDKMHGEGAWRFADQKNIKKSRKKLNYGLVKVKYTHGKLSKKIWDWWTIF